jgi:hypothetical protein
LKPSINVIIRVPNVKDVTEINVKKMIRDLGEIESEKIPTDREH